MQALQNDAFLREDDSPHLEIDVVRNWSALAAPNIENALAILETPEEQRSGGHSKQWRIILASW
jgi:hypothetical protein